MGSSGWAFQMRWSGAVASSAIRMRVCTYACHTSEILSRACMCAYMLHLHLCLPLRMLQHTVLGLCLVRHACLLCHRTAFCWLRKTDPVVSTLPCKLL